MGEQDENELYAKWRVAEPASRGDIERKLYSAIKRHAQAVLCETLNEVPPDDLVQAIVVAAMTGEFRQESKLSTWVEGIARRKAKAYIRGKVRARKVFDEYAFLEESDDDDSSEQPRGAINPSIELHLDGKIAVAEFRESLPTKDAALLLHKEAGLKSKQIAEAMGTTVEAVDNRWARLKRRANKFDSSRRK